MHLQPFEFLLHEKMGLDCQTLGSHVVLRFVQQRMAELEIDSSNDYLNLCHTNPDELKLLVSSATVQETWFFRDKGSLPALHAALLKLTASSFAPRILSFPCSTGEEPFSIVMGLDLLGFDISSLRVDAWDINPRAIDAANASLYGKNSFRGSDLGYRSRYFSEEENHFRLSSSIREKAHFRLANATELPAADFRSCFHAVFCRNLLIYLSPASQDRVLRNLLFMLHPEGILFVGSSETSIPLNYGLYPVPEKMSFGFKQSKAEVPKRKPLPIALRVTPLYEPVPPARAIPVPVRPAPLTTQEYLTRASQLANSGQFQEAETICRSLLAKGVNTPELWNLLGLTADARDRKEEAWKSYRKALYLDPSNYEALAQITSLAHVLGKATEALQFEKRLKKLKPEQL